MSYKHDERFIFTKSVKIACKSVKVLTNPLKLIVTVTKRARLTQKCLKNMYNNNIFKTVYTQSRSFGST